MAYHGIGFDIMALLPFIFSLYTALLEGYEAYIFPKTEELMLAGQVWMN
jgi:hypothetical protein